MMLGVGANINREEFSAKPSPFAQGILADPVKGTWCGGTTGLECDQRFGDVASSQPYSASSTSKGIFGEVIAPVLKELELGAALRFDDFSDFGGATTAKASFKWTPAPTLLIRGSFGNGFHAPTVPQVNALQRGYGVTSDKYTCTPALQAITTRLNARCQPGSHQYDQLAGGNRNLQPEKSKQATLGFPTSRSAPLPWAPTCGMYRSAIRQWTNTLKTGNWANSLTVSFLSGYKDQETSVDVLDAPGAVTGQEDIRMRVGFYSTLDWQTVLTPSKSWVLTAGMLNLADKSPPFVPSTSGANRGQQFGYDDRYYDPRGRTGYLNASYKF
ncbi:TonB-dependent receptor [Janthinobacterium sp. PAMC25594]|uniref:TonB-dependent receptor n=1 Tax=Janthinobacterium sp. PAMC25594 TaxID=2861284 RepID=UPI002159349B|nr:TonB-dependent receptor [Janthinobacterium sp. PAMC25594]